MENEIFYQQLKKEIIAFTKNKAKIRKNRSGNVVVTLDQFSLEGTYPESQPSVDFFIEHFKEGIVDAFIRRA